MIDVKPDQMEDTTRFSFLLYSFSRADNCVIVPSFQSFFKGASIGGPPCLGPQTWMLLDSHAARTRSRIRQEQGDDNEL